MQRRSSSCLSHESGRHPKGWWGKRRPFLMPQFICYMTQKHNQANDLELTDDEKWFLEFTGELYEREQRKLEQQIDRTVNPQDYDENGNPISTPDWWEGTAQQYKDWESSND